MRPGRSCPLHYRYAPSALAEHHERAAEILYVAGGLYGNVPALEALFNLVAGEPAPATIVFNGDFHWFDVDEASFRAIGAAVERHVALRGNVETELASDDGTAGCGCGYPDWVADEDVEHSNAIMERLRATARRRPAAHAALGRLPMYAVFSVAGIRVGVVHGDAHSLAGWDYAQEHLRTSAALERLRHDFAATRCRVIASSHTCLPVMAEVALAPSRAVLINNGAAGMPNFGNTRYGVVTRIAATPPAHVEPLYATRLEGVHIAALPLEYDHERWRALFLANWPAGTAAYQSYFRRIESGPQYAPAQAIRRDLADHAAAASREEIET